MDLGISFKNIREGKGKSVYALSKETGVSENHIHSIEKGTTQPSVAILERLLNALGVTLPEFFNDDRDVLYPSAYERELIASSESWTENRPTLCCNLQNGWSCDWCAQIPGIIRISKIVHRNKGCFTGPLD